MKRRIASITVFAMSLCLVACGEGCATSPAEATAYAALDDGYRLIKPLAEAGLAARNLPPDEAAHIQATIDNHAGVIRELQSGGSQ